MGLELIPMGGRYPYALAAYCIEDIRATLEVHAQTVRLRIDDVRNADRWEEFIIDRGTLQQALARSDSSFPTHHDSLFESAQERTD